MSVEVLKVVPSSVELKPGETQAFEAYGEDGKPAAGVTWSVAEEKVGHIAPEVGTYSARRFYRAHRLAVLARQADANGIEKARGSAVVDLDPARSWVPVLGAGWALLFAILLGTLLWNWSWLCPQCTPSGLFVSPPVVTLAGGQAQQFLANAAATWTNTVNTAGLYIAPSKIEAEQLVTVTATSTSDPRQSAMGVLRLSPAGGLSVLPSRVTVKQGEKVQLTASATGVGQDPVWLKPAAGSINPDGVYVAPDDPNPQAIIVLAQAQIPAFPPGPVSTLLAGALVSVIPKEPGPCEVSGSGLWRVILLVAWVGALGGLTHAMGSFGTYVGNRELKTSWLWWYGLKPALSAAVAVLVYLVFQTGLGTPDLGLDAADCLNVAGFAGLVGLFAEPATVKLKDIFEAIFTPRRDPRDDKAGQIKAPEIKAPANPQITDLEPRKLKAGVNTVLHLVGKDFAEGCVVQIGKQSFAPKFVSSAALEVTIPADMLPAATHAVVVYNRPPAGEPSKPIEITVEL